MRAIPVPSLVASIAAVLASQTLSLDLLDTVTGPLSIILIAVFGIPHGAADHLIHIQHAPNNNLVKFIAGYLGIMLAHLGVWLISAPLAFTIFLLFSIYHFGHGEFESMPHSKFHSAVYWSRGMVVLCMFVFSMPSVSFPIISAILGTTVSFTGTGVYVIACASALHLAVLKSQNLEMAFITGQCLRIAVLLVLFLYVHTYLAFAIYFSFFHALEFMYSVHFVQFDFARLVLQAFVPFSVPVLVVIAMNPIWIDWFTEVSGKAGVPWDILSTWHAFIIVVSVLTTPHVLYLHYLDSAKGSRPSTKLS